MSDKLTPKQKVLNVYDKAYSKKEESGGQPFYCVYTPNPGHHDDILGQGTTAAASWKAALEEIENQILSSVGVKAEIVAINPALSEDEDDEEDTPSTAARPVRKVYDSLYVTPSPQKAKGSRDKTVRKRREARKARKVNRQKAKR